MFPMIRTNDGQRGSLSLIYLPIVIDSKDVYRSCLLRRKAE